MRLFFRTALLCFLFAGTAVGQSEQEIKNSFLLGKRLLDEGNFRQAARTFEPISLRYTDNDYAVYASFFEAQAALKNGESRKAAETAAQILNKLPDWEHIEEVRYILADALLAEKQYEEASEQLIKLQKPALKAAASGLLKNRLQNASAAELQKMFRRFPSETTGRLLARAWQKAGTKNTDKPLYDSLLTVYKESGKPAVKTFERPAAFKDKYQIALVLPFETNLMNPNDSRRPTQYLMDLYQGMVLAKEDLDSLGIKIELLTYDTRRNPAILSRMLEEKQLSAADLIVGPVESGTAEIMQPFDSLYGIARVNPLSENLATVGPRKNTLLFRASYRTQGSEFARFALDSLRGAGACIYFGSEAGDSLRAEAFRETYQAGGGKVVVFRKIVGGSQMYYTFSRDLQKMSRQNSFVYISTDKEAQAVNLLSAVQSGRYDFPLLVTHDWLSFKGFSYEQFENAHIRFSYPDQIDFDNYFMENFRRRYAERTRMVPSVFALRGYELIYFYGKKLMTSGRYFYETQDKSFVPGRLFQGFRLGVNQDNGFVPICSFDKGRLILLNPEKKTTVSERKK